MAITANPLNMTVVITVDNDTFSDTPEEVCSKIYGPLEQVSCTVNKHLNLDY